jgi:hypothetical protein
MTDIERAREYAAKVFDARAKKYPRSVTMERHHAKVIRQCEGDDYDNVQSALLAIQSERERAKVLVEALQQAVTLAKFTYRARNGRDVYIHDHSGERMVMIPDDTWYQFSTALAAYCDGHE